MKINPPSYLRAIYFVLLLLLYIPIVAQNNGTADRFEQFENKLKELTPQLPGLSENVDLSVSGVSVQDFLRTLSIANNLNVSADPSINVKVYQTFSSVKAADVLLFLCKQYNLDLTFVGTIISFTPHVEVPHAPEPVKAKKINVNYTIATNTLSLDLTNDSIASVVKEITRASQKNVVFSPELSGKMISGFIDNLPFDNALSKIAFANDFKVTLTEDGVYLLEKKDVAKDTPKSSNSFTGGSRSNVTLPQGLNVKQESSGNISVEAANVPINEVIASISSLLKINYFLFSEIKGNTSLHITNYSYDQFLSYILNGTDYTFKKDSLIYLIGERNLEGLRSTRVVQLKYRTSSKITEVIPTDLKKGVDIKDFPDLNSLILSGSQPRINEIEAFLRDVDRVVPVVVIEVLIVDIKDTKTLTTGIEAGLKKGVKTEGKIYPSVDMTVSSSSINNIISGLNGLGLVNLGGVTPDFYVSLKAMEQQGMLKVRSTPKLSTLNGHEAKMSIGETEYYLELQSTLIGTQNPATTQGQNYKPIRADLSLTINPMVSGDEQITLEIHFSQADFTERKSETGPRGTITRDFQSMIRVKNDDMVVLGGLEVNGINESSTGIPLLSRIPVLKWLFSSRTKERKKSKLTIFIKPTVIY